MTAVPTKTFDRSDLTRRVLEVAHNPETSDAIARNALAELTALANIDPNEPNPKERLATWLDQLDDHRMEAVFRNAKVAFANDLFRRAGPKPLIGLPGQIVATESVNDDPNYDAILDAVRRFTDFTPDNDPHHEHDFGAVEVNGERFFFKIDYYDASYQYGVDPREQTPNRVLTIMRAEEY